MFLLDGWDVLLQRFVQVGQRCGGQREEKIMYASALSDVQAFVMGLYFQLVLYGSGIDIIRAFQEGKSVHVDDQAGEFIQDG